MAIDGRQVLEDVSFEVRSGERVVVVGVNGCGKTTLLRLLDGLAFPDAGEVRYAGRRLDAGALDEPAFRRRFRSEVGAPVPERGRDALQPDGRGRDRLRPAPARARGRGRAGRPLGGDVRRGGAPRARALRALRRREEAGRARGAARRRAARCSSSTRRPRTSIPPRSGRLVDVLAAHPGPDGRRLDPQPVDGARAGRPGGAARAGPARRPLRRRRRTTSSTTSGSSSRAGSPTATPTATAGSCTRTTTCTTRSERALPAEPVDRPRQDRRRLLQLGDRDVLAGPVRDA